MHNVAVPVSFGVLALLVTLSLLSSASGTACKSPPKISNGKHSGGSRNYFKAGEKVTYSCSTGYKLVGYSRLTCIYSRYGSNSHHSRSASYSWSHSDSSRSDSSHSDSSHSDSSHSDSSHSDSSHSDSSHSNSHSNSRFRSYSRSRSGSRSTSTSHSGSSSRSSFSGRGRYYWNSYPPKCIRITPPSKLCPFLSPPKNGGIIGSKRAIGSFVKYYCYSGYQLEGETYRKCLSTGSWTGSAARCVAIRRECPSLGNPSNGVVTFKEGRRVGAKVWYSCNSGYILVGSESRTCKSDLTWSSKAPVCRPIGCPPLDKPSGGSIKFSDGLNVGSRVTYSCDPTYFLKGNKVRKCLSDGSWTGSDPTCIRVQCPSLGRPNSGSIKFSDGLNVGSRATYSCNLSYVLKGNEFRDCLLDGTWTGSDPTCIRLRCPDLPDIPSGSVSLSGRTPGSTATYTCISGYELEGNSVRTCQDNEEWSGSEPFCRRLRCPDLPNIPSGSVSLSGRTPGSTATYTCISGYELEGNSVRTCQDNEEWSGSEPFCRRLRCPDLPNIPSGSVSLSGRTPGSTATYSCIPGYELEGSSVRTCQNSEEWSGSEPFCRRLRCPDLPDIPSGSVSLNGRTPGSIATYSCIPGYELEGSSVRTCQDNEEWSGSEPFCRRLRCSDLPDIPSGSVSLSGRTPGSTATYSCISGYELEGNSVRTCQDNEEWSGSEPFCSRLRCPDLPNIPSGSVSLSGRTPGSTATYSCIPGYALEGSSVRTCQNNEEWSGSEPFCRRLRCPDLPDIPSGSVSLSGRTPGSTATYTCISGYALKGSSVRTCQNNEEWSGSEPSCVFVPPFDCGPLSDPENGDVDTSDGTTIDSVAIYSCNTGYELKGVTTRTCTDSGWSDKEPTCEIVDCGFLPDPSFGQVVFQDTVFQSIATYFCFDGYEISGSSTRTCQANGEWSGVAPTCVAVECGSLPNPANGRVSLNGVTFGSFANYICFSGYRLVGTSQRSCQANGQWSDEAPVCIAECADPTAPANGRVTFTGNSVGDTATYTCNSGFELVGSEVAICTQIDANTAVFSPGPPTCQRLVCPTLSGIDNGSVQQSGTAPGSVARYDCNQGYDLIGGDERLCQDNGVWSGSEPFCKIVDCGPLPRPQNGFVDFDLTIFGSTATYSCFPDFELRGAFSRTCQADGTWSSSEPSCVRGPPGPQCPLLSNPANGNVFQNGVSEGSLATYECDLGFDLTGGDPIRFCQSNGRWTGTAPTCQPSAPCPQLPNPDNGEVTITGFTLGSGAIYDCDFSYQITSGDEVRFCQADGTWDGTEPTCSLIDCGPLENPANGVVQLSSTTFGSGATYDCFVGFTLVGVDSRICIETGEWSDEAPVCNPDVCPVLQDPENGRVTVSGSTFGSVATYECDSGFVLFGNAARSCLAGGVWSGVDPECGVPREGCGDPGVPANGRRVGDDFLTGSVVFFRCFDNFDRVGSAYRECLDSGLWSGTQPTCQPFDDTCVEGVNMYDRCERRCDCVNGHFENCCRVRRDYAALSTSNRLEFINTYLEVVNHRVYGPRYLALIDTYTNSFENDITQSTSPSISQLFMFNRYFLLEFEDILRDFNCSLTVPYYDWTPFPVAPYTAAVWANTDGFGDSARSEDKCVIKGPFRVGEYSISPSSGGGCLQREYMNQRFPSRDLIERDILTLPSAEFEQFHRFLHLYVGINVQCYIGGTICSEAAANDPVYLLHIAQLDAIFQRWQSIGQGRETVRYSTDTSPLLEAPGFAVRDFNDNFALPYQACVYYGPPALLKNHAPPSSTLHTALRALECAPEDSMAFMGMTQVDHDFMHEVCL